MDILSEDKIVGFTRGVFESIIEDSIYKNILEISDFSLKKGINVSNKLAGKIYTGSQVEVDLLQIDKNIIDFLLYKCKKYLYLLGNPNYSEFSLKMKDAWIVSQYEHDYNPIHRHNGFISGIIYLKIPASISSRSKKYIEKEFDSEDFLEERNTDGKIDFIIDSGPFDEISNGWVGQRHRKLITPKEKYLYLFPSWMMHTVYPFSGEGERRVFAFNLCKD